MVASSSLLAAYYFKKNLMIVMNSEEALYHAHVMTLKMTSFHENALLTSRKNTTRMQRD